jgi:hypothetical protein
MEQQKDFIDEHIDDIAHNEKIEQDLSNAIQEEKQMKKLVDLFMLALLLVFAMYSIF